MPQMSPLMWLILYMYFILLFMFMNILMYYFFFDIKHKICLIMKNNYLNFKWFW